MDNSQEDIPMSANVVILIGNLGADPDLRYTSSGKAVCELRVATSDSWNDKDGQRHERTEWHRVVVWGTQGESCGKYLTKGRQVYVRGRIQTRSYEKDGVKKYITEVNADDVQFLGSKPEGAGARNGTEKRAKQAPKPEPRNPWDSPDGAETDVPS